MAKEEGSLSEVHSGIMPEGALVGPKGELDLGSGPLAILAPPRRCPKPSGFSEE